MSTSTSMRIALNSNIFALLEGEDNDDVQQIIVKHNTTKSSTTSSSSANKGVKKNNKVEKVKQVKPAPLPAAASKLKKPEPRPPTVYQQPQKVQRSRLQKQKAVDVQQSYNLKDMINNIRAGLNGKVVNNNNGLGKDKDKDKEKEKEKEVESVVMTLEEYENKRKAAELAEKKKKTEERKVKLDKDFESMRLVCKKEQQVGVYSATINSAAKKTKKGRGRKAVNKIEDLWKKCDDEEITRVVNEVKNVDVSRSRSWSNLPKDFAATPATQDFPTLPK